MLLVRGESLTDCSPVGESLEPRPHGRVTVCEKLSPKEYSSRFLYNLGLANGYGVLIMAGADGVIWHPSTPGQDVGLTFAGCWGHFCRVQPKHYSNSTVPSLLPPRFVETSLSAYHS